MFANMYPRYKWEFIEKGWSVTMIDEFGSLSREQFLWHRFSFHKLKGKSSRKVYIKKVFEDGWHACPPYGKYKNIVVALRQELLYHLLFFSSIMISCFHRGRGFIAQKFLINIIEIQERYLLCVFRCSVSIGFSQCMAETCFAWVCEDDEGFHKKKLEK